VGFLYLTSGSKATRVSWKIKLLPEVEIEPGTPGPKPGTLSTRLSLHIEMSLIHYMVLTNSGPSSAL